MNIVFWLVSALFNSLALNFRKKSVSETSLPTSLLVWLWPFFWFFVLGIIILFSWINTDIFFDYKSIFLISIVVILSIAADYLEVYVFKKTKISELLPYTNLDKLFIVLIWFFLFFWTKNSTSITTLLITLFTIIVIAIFSIDFKKLKIPKSITAYTFVMLFRAIWVLIVWYIFLKYNTIDYVTINNIFYFLFYIIIAIYLKDDFKTLFKQSKAFYIAREISLLVWWWGFIVWLYIVKESWVLVATLISFVWLILNIITMKLILKDTPSKKQISLAIIVTFLIWIWFYFK